MKAPIACSILGLLCILLLPTQAQQDPLETLKASEAKARKTQIEEPFQTKLTDLQQKYKQALEREVKKAQDAGNLDAVVALQKEVDADADTWIQTDASIPELAKLRKVYQSGVAMLEADRDDKLREHLAKVQAAIKKREEELTKNGDVEQALAYRAFSTEMASLAPEPSQAMLEAALEEPEEITFGQWIPSVCFVTERGYAFRYYDGTVYIKDPGALGERPMPDARISENRRMVMWTIDGGRTDRSITVDADFSEAELDADGPIEVEIHELIPSDFLIGKTASFPHEKDPDFTAQVKFLEDGEAQWIGQDEDSWRYEKGQQPLVFYLYRRSEGKARGWTLKVNPNGKTAGVTSLFDKSTVEATISDTAF